LSTAKKRIKIELEDAEGGKYNLSLEGNLSKDKIQKVLQLVESLNTTREESNNEQEYHSSQSDNSYKNDIKSDKTNQSIESKIWKLIENNFAYSSFTSSNIADSYEELYRDPIQLSLISTYLSRYFEKHKLIRTKRGKEWLYKLIRNKMETVPPIGAFSDDHSSQMNSSTLDYSNENEFLKQNALTTVYDLHL
jgi:hypothetical protein